MDLKTKLINFLKIAKGISQADRAEMLALLTKPNPQVPGEDYINIENSELGVEQISSFLDTLIEHTDLPPEEAERFMKELYFNIKGFSLK